MKKPKLQAFSSKGMNLKVTLGGTGGGTGHNNSKSPLTGLSKKSKDYSKKQAPDLISNANFGDTGLTGES